jgi:hypothetical protein
MACIALAGVVREARLGRRFHFEYPCTEVLGSAAEARGVPWPRDRQGWLGHMG